MTTSHINPKDTLIEIKDKNTGAKKPYLLAHAAIAWFREDFPLARIIPSILDIEKKIVRCEIWVEDIMIAAADVMGDGTKSLEKLETNAVRRALAFAGYGTITALAYEDADDDSSSAARVELASQSMGGPTAMREILAPGGNHRIGSQPNGNGNMPAHSDPGGHISGGETEIVVVQEAESRRAQNNKLYVSLLTTTRGRINVFAERLPELTESGWFAADALKKVGDKITFPVGNQPTVQLGKDAGTWIFGKIIPKPASVPAPSPEKPAWLGDQPRREFLNWALLQFELDEAAVLLTINANYYAAAPIPILTEARISEIQARAAVIANACEYNDAEINQIKPALLADTESMQAGIATEAIYLCQQRHGQLPVPF